jgi:hypothetical protein
VIYKGRVVFFPHSGYLLRPIHDKHLAIFIVRLRRIPCERQSRSLRDDLPECRGIRQARPAHRVESRARRGCSVRIQICWKRTKYSELRAFSGRFPARRFRFAGTLRLRSPTSQLRSQLSAASGVVGAFFFSRASTWSTVRGSRCCGSEPDGCDPVGPAAVCLDRARRAVGRDGPSGRSARRCPEPALRCE